MKTKNVILAAFAFMLAIGGAFASFFAPEDVYVKAKLKSAPNGATVCVDTNIQCDATGSLTCSVTVPTNVGNQTASTNSSTFRPYRGTACTVQLTGITGASGGTSTIDTIDHLVAED